MASSSLISNPLRLVLVLASAVVLILSIQISVKSQSAREICSQGLLTSLFCKAGQTVLGSAARFADRLLRRQHHWGVPADEPLELYDDFSVNQVGPPQYDDSYDFSNFRRMFRDGPKVPWPTRRRKRVLCRTDVGEGICRPLHICYHRHGSSIRYILDGNQCPQGSSMVCCPKDRHNKDEQQFDFVELGKKIARPLTGPTINTDSLRSIVDQVSRQPSEDVRRSNEIERVAADQGFTLKQDSPGDLHQKFIRLRDVKLVQKLSKDGADFLAVASRVAENQPKGEKCGAQGESTGEGTIITQDRNNSSCDVTSRAGEIDFSKTELASRCPNDPVCSIEIARSRYRTYDGRCNNLKHTSWGSANTPYTRILDPDYEDDVNAVRATGVTGQKLPNPRTITLATVILSERQDNQASLMLMQWGQFIDHDLTFAATTPMLTPQGKNIDCCNRRLLTDPKFKHPACISILLPDSDPFYSRNRVGCMNLVRNAPAPPVGCRLRHREQLNQLTSFIDGSMIYGNDEQQAIDLRRLHGGLLKSSSINGAEFLPFNSRVGDGCILPTEGIRRGMRCFLTGDQRSNELTGLVTAHTLFLREHNRIARILWSLNGDWSDEQLYQETRRLVIAEIQHITYNEWLPLIVGPTVMRDFRLELSQINKGFFYDYDPQTNPSIINEFAGAAYRLHSLVQGSFNFQTEDGRIIQQFKLRNIFNNPASLYREGNYDGCIHSMINEPAQSIDNHFTQEIVNHLFQDMNASFGMDLVTVNIQRGRDHGIPGYNFFRQACGLQKVRSFQELDRVMTQGAGRIFSQLYTHVDDIDLFIAGSYEKKLRNAMVGPVFACIIGEQFRRTRFGDRYWYENGNQAGIFSPRQLAEIKRGASIARIICDNSDTIERIQPLAFLKPSNWNQKIPCEQIPYVDLRVWQQNYVDEQEDYDGVRSSNSDLDDGLD